MGFITYVEAQCIKTITQRQGEGTWKDTAVGFLYYMQTVVVFPQGWF